MYHVVVCDHMAADGFSTRNRHDWRRDTRVCLSSGAAQALGNKVCLVAAGLAGSLLAWLRPELQAERRRQSLRLPCRIPPLPTLAHASTRSADINTHSPFRHSPAPVNTSPSTHISRSIRLSVSPSLRPHTRNAAHSYPYCAPTADTKLPVDPSRLHNSHALASYKCKRGNSSRRPATRCSYLDFATCFLVAIDLTSSHARVHSTMRHGGPCISPRTQGLALSIAATKGPARPRV